MKEMIKFGEEFCFFEFNFDEKIFKFGDMVSYCVIGSFVEMLFVGVLLEVYDDYVILVYGDGYKDLEGFKMRGIWESCFLV